MPKRVASISIGRVKMTHIRNFLFIGLLALTTMETVANVIGIDLGTDFMKVALVAPRRPLEIVTNLASKRKTAMAIHFDRGERSFGGDAVVMLSRKPAQTFTKLVPLLGRHEDHPDIKAFESTELPPLSWNQTRGGVNLTLKDRGTETQFLPEELVAMMLTHASDMTHLFGYTVHDAVLTVPQFWTAHERYALADAVELSTLSALYFLDENTAAALQYAIDHPYDEPYTVLFYNMGAASTQVSIITFSPKMVKDKNVGQFVVRGKAWDTSLGGHWFDLVLADMLAQRFNTKWGKGDVRDNPRAMAKLRVQAAKVKQVLSANFEIPLTIESLHDDVDFTTLVTRAEFEVAANSLFERVTKPVDSALKAAGMTASDINEIEILGGGVRVPRVQELLSAYLDPLNIGVHLNGDEAFALGAAFAGANASRAFHVRQVGMTDITPFAVDLHLADAPTSVSETSSGGVFASIRQKLNGTDKDKEQAQALLKAAEGELEDNDDEGESSEFSKTVALFAVNSLTSSRKSITLKHTRDLRANVTYADENPYLPSGTQTIIASYNISGIEKFATEMLKEGLGIPKVTLRFSMDTFGVPSLIEAFAEVSFEKEVSYEEEVEIDDEKQSSTEEPNNTVPENADSDVEKNTSDAVTPDVENSSNIERKDEVEGENTVEKEKESSAEKKKKPKSSRKKKTQKVTKTKMVTQTRKQTLDIFRHFSFNELRPMNAEEKKHSHEKLAKLEGEEKVRHAKAAAKNDLETYILMVRSSVSDDAKAELIAVSTEKQREEIVEVANELEEWLYDDGWDEDADVYRAKKLRLSKLAEPVFTRVSEASARPAEVKRARLYLNKVRDSIEKWRKSKPQITEDEIEDLLEKIEKAEQWISDKEDLQNAQAPHDPPIFSSVDVEPQLKSVNTLVSRLSKKPAPKVEKAPKPDPAQNSTESAAPEKEEKEDVDDENRDEL